jgi:hypothetical protein
MHAPSVAAFGPQLAQAQGQPIGEITTALGSIHVKHADGSEAELTTGGKVYADDVIRTDPDGGVQIRFVDGTDFVLGGNAEMTIDRLIYDPSGSGNAMNMLVAGAFVFVTGSIAGAPGEGMRVDTPAGSIGIRGTSVAGRYSETQQGYLLALLRDIAGNVGHVVVSNEGGRVDLDELFEATLLRDRQTPPQTAFKLTLEQIQQLFGPLLQLDPELDLQNESYEKHTELENLIIPAAGGGGGAFHSGGLNSAFLGLLFDALLGPGFGGDIGALGETGLGGPLHPLEGTFLGNFEPTTPPSVPEKETVEGEGSDTIFGTPGPDTLVGGPRNEFIFGEESNDSIAGGGNDSVDAGAGNDSIEGGPGNDSIDAGAGDDTACGGEGNDLIIGGDGNDSLCGDDGNDSILGSAGADHIDGGTGGDTIHGGAGDDSIEGGDGNDLLVGGDSVAGDVGDNPIHLAATTALGTGGNALINGLGGPAGFGEGVLAPNDDDSTGPIDITSVFPDGMNFFGTTYTAFYINNNGNITFGGSISEYTPTGLTTPQRYPIIAPFWADVDTRGSHDLTPTPGGNSTGKQRGLLQPRSRDRHHHHHLGRRRLLQRAYRQAQRLPACHP